MIDEYAVTFTLCRGHVDQLERSAALYINAVAPKVLNRQVLQRYILPIGRSGNRNPVIDSLVGRAGFEPATNGLKVRCSTN